MISPPRPEETVIEGRWLANGAKVAADEAALRIDGLTTCYLKFIGRSANGWSMLYRDPGDGRLWEQSYPHSECHGGGPPKLEVISQESAHQRYSITA